MNKKIITLLQTLSGWVIYFISFLCKRNKKIWVFGSNHNGFNGNSKYLILHVKESHGDIRPVWIASSVAEAEYVRTLGIEAYQRWQFKALLICLKAGIYFIGGRLTDIHFWTSGGAIVINLWHGIGIKKQGYIADDPLSVKIFHTNRLHTKIFNPQLLKAPDFFLSTTPHLSQIIYIDSFRLRMDQILHFGFPRSDHFFLSLEEQKKLIQNYEPEQMLKLVELMEGYDKVYFYLPTYRDNQYDFIEESNIDFERLNEIMEKTNSLFLFKFHPWTRLKSINVSDLQNVKELPKEFDIYRIMPFVDCLITDYSSVYDDFILMGKKVILYTFDYTDYIKNDRSFVKPYSDHYKMGTQIFTFEELDKILSGETDLNAPDTKQHLKSVWGDYKGQSCKDLCSFVKKL